VTEALKCAGSSKKRRGVLPIDTVVKPVNQIRCLDPKSPAYPEKSPYGNWPAGFDLLPVARRESIANHVFLRVTVGLA
jgi:hypothetical protein